MYYCTKEGEEKGEVSLNRDEIESLQVQPWKIHQPPVLHFIFREFLRSFQTKKNTKSKFDYGFWKKGICSKKKVCSL